MHVGIYVWYINHALCIKIELRSVVIDLKFTQRTAANIAAYTSTPRAFTFGGSGGIRSSNRVQGNTEQCSMMARSGEEYKSHSCPAVDRYVGEGV